MTCDRLDKTDSSLRQAAAVITERAAESLLRNEADEINSKSKISIKSPGTIEVSTIHDETAKQKEIFNYAGQSCFKMMSFDVKSQLSTVDPKGETTGTYEFKSSGNLAKAVVSRSASGELTVKDASGKLKSSSEGSCKVKSLGPEDKSSCTANIKNADQSFLGRLEITYKQNLGAGENIDVIISGKEQHVLSGTLNINEESKTAELILKSKKEK